MNSCTGGANSSACFHWTCTVVHCRCLTHTTLCCCCCQPSQTSALDDQAAQRFGGDIDFWADLLVQYVDCRLAGSYTTTADAREALQVGASLTEH